MNKFLFLAVLFGIALGTQAASIAFPAGFVPFTSIYYVTQPLPDGDRLVLGNSFLAAHMTIFSLPLPSAGQVFSDSSIELAPGQFFSGVYVPTMNDRYDYYPDFAGLLIDPRNGFAFAGGIIPQSISFGFYAFRLAPLTTPTPEPGTMVLFAAVAALTIIRGGLRVRRRPRVCPTS